MGSYSMTKDYLTIDRLVARLREALRLLPPEFQTDLQVVINMLSRNPPDQGKITIWLDEDYRW